MAAHLTGVRQATLEKVAKCAAKIGRAGVVMIDGKALDRKNRTHGKGWSKSMPVSGHRQAHGVLQSVVTSLIAKTLCDGPRRTKIERPHLTHRNKAEEEAQPRSGGRRWKVK